MRGEVAGPAPTGDKAELSVLFESPGGLWYLEKKRGGRRSNQQNSERNSELENGEKGESRAAVLRCKR